MNKSKEPVEKSQKSKLSKKLPKLIFSDDSQHDLVVSDKNHLENGQQDSIFSPNFSQNNPLLNKQSNQSNVTDDYGQILFTDFLNLQKLSQPLSDSINNNPSSNSFIDYITKKKTPSISTNYQSSTNSSTNPLKHFPSNECLEQSTLIEYLQTYDWDRPSTEQQEYSISKTFLEKKSQNDLTNLNQKKNLQQSYQQIKKTSKIQQKTKQPESHYRKEKSELRQLSIRKKQFQSQKLSKNSKNKNVKNLKSKIILAKQEQNKKQELLIQQNQKMSQKKRNFCKKLQSFNSLDLDKVKKCDELVLSDMSNEFKSMRFGGLELIKEVSYELDSLLTTSDEGTFSNLNQDHQFCNKKGPKQNETLSFPSKFVNEQIDNFTKQDL